MKVFAVGVAAIVALAGCTDRPPTSELSARMTVTVHGALIEFEIELSHQGTAYEIEPDEHALVHCRDQSYDSLLGWNQYQREVYFGRLGLDPPLDGDEPITFELNRGPNDSGSVMATAPPPVLLEAPTTVRASESVTVQWTPVSSDPMRWEKAEAFDNGPIPPGIGSVTFPPGVLAPVSTQYAEDVRLMFMRERDGATVSGLMSGGISITREHDTTFEITP